MILRIVIVLFALIIQLCNCYFDNVNRKSDFFDAMNYLNKLMNPQNCSGIQYLLVEMGCGGGFAAHFQLAASEWLVAASSYNYSKPVLITGHIRGYSDGEECAYIHHEWTCFFLPFSECQNEMLSTGVRINPLPIGFTSDEEYIPLQFRHLGMAFWWGIIQARMFRLQPNIIEYVEMESHLMNDGKGFPYDISIAGIHVRHGDKRSDGFVEHSFESEILALQKSPECIINHRNATVNICESLNFQSVNVTTNTTKIPVFVASDDIRVLNAARKVGHLVDSAGISQQTSNSGMFQTLINNPTLGYNASVEIITDIHFLSHCTSLVGIAASQVYRMSVDISNATGRLRYAVAIDYDQIPKVRHMSRRYGIFMPEDFSKP